MAVTLPKINITFKQLATSFIQRSERGVAVLIVRDAVPWCGTATAVHTSRSAPTTAARRPSPGAGCIGQTSGCVNSGQNSSCGSPSAGSVPSEASEPGPPTWTTSWTTRVTGMCSVIRPTWRAFATAATAVKRRGNCGKTARKRNDAEAQNGASLGRWRAMRGASCGDPCTLPRGQKSFDPASADRMPPFTQKIFPTGKCGRGCCGDASGSAWVLRGRSGAGPDAAGVQRDWPGCCMDAARDMRVSAGRLAAV